MKPDWILRNVAVLDVDRGHRSVDMDVHVSAGRMARIAPTATASAAATNVIDVGGRTLMPGLIDLHVQVTAVRMDLGQQARMSNLFVLLRALPILRACSNEAACGAWTQRKRRRRALDPEATLRISPTTVHFAAGPVVRLRPLDSH